MSETRAPEAEIVGRALDLLATRGSAAYLGEPVTQAEHMLQAATIAERDGAPDALVAAALLHDVGHLLHQLGEDVAERGIDARHERIGAGWLARGLPPSVVEPVRLHVAAKRYLCATERGYHERLSPASLESLALQGGAMTPAEVEAFEAEPHAHAALALRRLDEAAKVDGMATPALEHFRPLLERLARVRASGAGGLDPGAVTDPAADGADATDLEHKVLVPRARAGRVLAALEEHLLPDPEFPATRVASVYFDTPALELLRGTWPRRSSDAAAGGEQITVRLRWYEPVAGADRAFVELKRRAGGARLKRRRATPYRGAELAAMDLADGRLAPLAGALELGDLAPAMLAPRLELVYERRRFVDPRTGLRVSLDVDLAVRRLDPCIPRLATGRPPIAVLELKGPSHEETVWLEGLLVLSGGAVAPVWKYRVGYESVTSGEGSAPPPRGE